MRHACGGAKENKVTDYAKLEKEVGAKADVIWDMASKIWTFAELGIEGKKSSAYEATVIDWKYCISRARFAARKKANLDK
jgi:hypothetical protein